MKHRFYSPIFIADLCKAKLLSWNAVRALPLLFSGRPDQNPLTLTTAEIRRFYGGKNARDRFIGAIKEINRESRRALGFKVIQKIETGKKGNISNRGRIVIRFTAEFIEHLKKPKARRYLTFPDHNGETLKTNQRFFYPVAYRIAVDRSYGTGTKRLTTPKLLEYVSYVPYDNRKNRNWKRNIESPLLNTLKLMNLPAEESARFKEFWGKVWNIGQADRKKPKGGRKGGKKRGRSDIQFPQNVTTFPQSVTTFPQIVTRC